MSIIIENSEDRRVIHKNEYNPDNFETSKLIEQEKQLVLPFAKGLMRQWYFEGIRMSYVDWNYQEVVPMQTKGDLDMVTLYFNLNGSLSIKDESKQEPFLLDSNQHNMLYSNGESVNIMPHAGKVRVFMVQFSKAAFLSVTENSSDILKRFGERVLNGHLVSLSDNSLPIDIGLSNAIHAVIRSNFEPGLKKIFLLSKAIEILVLQAESFNNHDDSPSGYLQTREEKQMMIEARDILIANLLNPPSLSQLARQIGTNEFKLKKGFKEVFNNTVFGYLSDSRL